MPQARRPGQAYDLGELIESLHHPAYLSVFQADLNPTRVERGTGKDIFHNSAGSFSGALIFLENDLHFQSGINIFSILTVHRLQK